MNQLLPQLDTAQLPTSNYTLRFATTPLRLCAAYERLAQLVDQALAVRDCCVNAGLDEAGRHKDRVGSDVWPLAIHYVRNRSDYAICRQRR
jgi:hypothetical protein